MRTIEQTLYTYDELPDDDAKAKARDWYNGLGLGYEWWDSAYDDAKAIGGALGFHVRDIFFSGFYSQGDGASFTGSYEYSKGWRDKLKAYCPNEEAILAIGERLQSLQRRRFFSLQASISTSGRYSHEGSMRAAVETADGGDVSTAEETEFLDCAQDLARWIYSRLETEYEWLTGEECVAESLRANGYEFLADGSHA